MNRSITGGCQCGAVRYRADGLGRGSICHCRMCQKAFGGFFGPLVHTRELTWTRGEPKWFRSSNKVRRGFCANCGTPLTFDYGGPLEVTARAPGADHQREPTAGYELVAPHFLAQVSVPPHEALPLRAGQLAKVRIGRVRESIGSHLGKGLVRWFEDRIAARAGGS